MTTIQALVDRFLGWKLPPTFGPDAGIKFTPSNGMSREDAYSKPGWWPIGTNLLSAEEARAMLEYLLGTPTRMWAIAKQHPEHTEVSMFLTSSEATAKEYERLGWTARPVDVLPAGSEAHELSLRELDAIGRAYFNGPLNSNEEMFGRAIERVVRRRLLGTSGVAASAPLRTALDLTLTQGEAQNIAAFLDDDAESDAEVVRLLIGDGHSGYGLYAAHPDYPGEGAMLVKNLPAPDGVDTSHADQPKGGA